MITTNKGLAYLSFAFAGLGRHITKRPFDFAYSLKVAAHLLARRIRVDGLAAAKDTRGDAGGGKVGDDFIA